MTKVYKKVATAASACVEQIDSTAALLGLTGFRPSRKTLASIEYEKKFQAPNGSQAIIVPKKGIDASQKSKLQDEYVTKPRKISTIPCNLNLRSNTEKEAAQATAGEQQELFKSGKKLAPPAIPQVFLL